MDDWLTESRVPPRIQTLAQLASPSCKVYILEWYVSTGCRVEEKMLLKDSHDSRLVMAPCLSRMLMIWSKYGLKELETIISTTGSRIFADSTSCGRPWNLSHTVLGSPLSPGGEFWEALRGAEGTGGGGRKVTIYRHRSVIGDFFERFKPLFLPFLKRDFAPWLKLAGPPGRHTKVFCKLHQAPLDVMWLSLIYPMRQHSTISVIIPSVYTYVSPIPIELIHYIHDIHTQCGIVAIGCSLWGVKCMNLYSKFKRGYRHLLQLKTDWLHCPYYSFLRTVWTQLYTIKVTLSVILTGVKLATSGSSQNKLQKWT